MLILEGATKAQQAQEVFCLPSHLLPCPYVKPLPILHGGASLLQL